MTWPVEASINKADGAETEISPAGGCGVPVSVLPVPVSVLPVPVSVLPVPVSVLPVPVSVLPVPVVPLSVSAAERQLGAACAWLNVWDGAGLPAALAAWGESNRDRDSRIDKI